jgi:predicted peroxiredoxin
MSSAFFSYPARELTLVGITGTKGKTTSALLAARMLASLGEKVGYIGSNGIEYLERHYSTLNTTPDSYTLNSTFRSMADQGVKIVVMEVSSQAVLMHRIEGLSFHACAFPNLAHDHIGVGEHDSFENYRDCKAKLFSDFSCKTMIYNPYDTASEYMRKNASAERFYSFSAMDKADFYVENMRSFRRQGALGVDFKLFAYGEEHDADVVSTVKPYPVFTEISDIFPDFVNESLREGIKKLSEKICDFGGGSVLVAPETRSSSPVRIVRGDDLNSTSVKGVYPCGEGAGYAGGIMSAAVDGMKCAEAIIETLNQP